MQYPSLTLAGAVLLISLSSCGESSDPGDDIGDGDGDSCEAGSEGCGTQPGTVNSQKTQQN